MVGVVGLRGSHGVASENPPSGVHGIGVRALSRDIFARPASSASGSAPAATACLNWPSASMSAYCSRDVNPAFVMPISCPW